MIINHFYSLLFRRVLPVIVLALMTITAKAQTPSSDAVRAYINKYKALSLDHERRYGIPATITLAQGILESAAGQSTLARTANNHFGIKALGGWRGAVYKAWDDEPQKSSFRVYANAEESFEDHSKVLKESRYRPLFGKSIYDYRAWARELKKCGYATSPTYAAALIGYIETYRLYEINGGVKLTPGVTRTFTVPITKEVIQEIKEQDIDTEETTEEEAEMEEVFRKVVVEINDVRCTILYPGETLSNIAMKYDIPKQKLLEYNETTSEEDIHDGDVVFLDKKKKEYDGPLPFYRVKEGETLYQIAQRFGVRTSSLTRINNIDIFTPLRPGMTLRLKK